VEERRDTPAKHLKRKISGCRDGACPVSTTD